MKRKKWSLFISNTYMIFSDEKKIFISDFKLLYEILMKSALEGRTTNDSS